MKSRLVRSGPCHAVLARHKCIAAGFGDVEEAASNTVRLECFARWSTGQTGSAEYMPSAINSPLGAISRSASSDLCSCASSNFQQ